MKHKLNFVLVLVFSVMAVIGNAQGYIIKNYDVKIHVPKSGQLAITETIQVEFLEERRGIIRDIPYEYKMDGKTLRFDVYDVEVAGEKTKITRSKGNVSVRIGDSKLFLTGPKQYVITYKVDRPFIYHDNFTEFYYNVIGDQWDTSIEKAKFSISFEQAVNLTGVDFRGFYGSYQSKDSLQDLSFANNILSGRASASLNPYEGITVTVKLPIEAVIRPSKQMMWWKKYGFIVLPGSIALALLGLFYNIWYKYGKDYPHVVAARFTPPVGISPAEAGVIVDERVDDVDVMVLIPYWGQQGLIHIKRLENKWSKDDHELKKLKDIGEVKPYEKLLFNKIFETGDTIKVSDLENTFHTTVTTAKSLLKHDINTQDIYYKSSQNMQIVLGALSFLAILLGLGLAMYFHNFIPAVVMAVVGIVGFVFTAYMIKKTRNGIRMFEEVIGFKEFIQKADKDRIERLLKDDPMYFEKSLPYAIVFGYAKKWGEKFDGLLTAPPQWYTSSNPMMYSTFSPGTFSQDLTSGVRDIQSSFTSVPSTSSDGSGGSFGGGGFSGGGFGGGGGSSW